MASMEMQLLEIETRRNIKPGDLFKAHVMSATAAVEKAAASSEMETLVSSKDSTAVGESMSDINQIPAAVEKAAASSKMETLVSSKDSTAVGESMSDINQILAAAAKEGGELEHMERLQMGVMDAIHDALSKEALVKKLIIPFSLENKQPHALHWEWRKNTALLELEQRNQQLQHRLREAGQELVKARCLAQDDRKRLEEALKKGREELHLIQRADTMRNRLIEQKRAISRSHTLYVTLLSWQRFCQACIKRKTLKKAEDLWRQFVLMKRFDCFVRGFERIKHHRQLEDRGRCHLAKTSLRLCYRSWLMSSRKSRETMQKVDGFIKSWSVRRLKAFCETWRGEASYRIWKQAQKKRAEQVWRFKRLRKAWQEWGRHILLARANVCDAEHFAFLRLTGDCFSGWRTYCRVKSQRSKRSALCAKLRESRLHQIAFAAWTEKIRHSYMVLERQKNFVRRCERKLLLSMLTKWHLFISSTRCLRSLEKALQLKSRIWSKRRVFLQLKKRWTTMKVFRKLQSSRGPRIQSALFQFWRHTVRSWKAAKMKVKQMRTRIERRWQRRSFFFWMAYAAERRNVALAKATQELTAKVGVLETDRQGAERVRERLDELVLQFENEKDKFINSAEDALVRTPVWTSGFLDGAHNAKSTKVITVSSSFVDTVELRWRTPSLSWLPPARAGHTAVSLHGMHTRSLVVVFGGYDGERCFNEVLIFDTDRMQWKCPALSAAEGNVIPPAMQTHTACAFGKKKMVLFGGYDGALEFADASVLTVSEDGSACQWSQLQFATAATKPGQVCQHTSCVYEGGSCMIVFGGYRSQVGLLNELWILNLHRVHWTCPEYFGEPPAPCRGHGAGVIGSKMYVFGGYNGKDHSAELHALDMDTMTWEHIEGQGQAPSPRRQHSITVVGRHMVVFGGYDGHRYLEDLFSFDTVHKRWTQWPTDDGLSKLPGASSVCGRSMHTMVETGQRLALFGGVHEWGALQDVVFLENSAAVDGLGLQSSYLEEVQKVTKLQTQVTKYEAALAGSATQLASTDSTLAQTRSTLLASPMNQLNSFKE